VSGAFAPTEWREGFGPTRRLGSLEGKTSTTPISFGWAGIDGHTVDSDVFGRVAPRGSACWLNLNRCVAFAACSLALRGSELSMLSGGDESNRFGERERAERCAEDERTCAYDPVNGGVTRVTVGCAFADDTSVR
jgi:hypothetical protein